jgi:hypothetical protein
MNSTHGREFQRSAVVNANTAMVHSRSEDVISPRKSDNSDNRNEHEGALTVSLRSISISICAGEIFCFPFSFFKLQSGKSS